MNGRILELAKNPEIFQIQDLELLNSEINKHPYIQSLRALHLLGTHRLQRENYTNELSITAAYTTDKKILYQLINSAKETNPSLEAASSAFSEQPLISEKPVHQFTDIESNEIDIPKPVFVKGELNRILFEGEEDFLERDAETIDLESTIEAGQIVINKTDFTPSEAESTKLTETKEAEIFTKEEIIPEETIAIEEEIIENPTELSFHETAEFLPEIKVEINSENIPKKEISSQEKTISEDASELSFHATADFLPEVKIVSNQEKAPFQEIIKPAVNKHEEEIKRLIEEVEAKMKASKKQKSASTEKEENQKSAEVNFSETQSFEIKIIETETIAEKPALKTVENLQESIEIKTESTPEIKSDWKPMSFSSNTPDALISKKEQVQTEKNLINKQEKETPKEENSSTERPIFNVSFFTQNVSSLNKLEETTPLPEEVNIIETLEDSNVPEFINTWQSWLKIDRSKEETKEKIEISITEIKNKVIENFIEKEPKISKLKEESDFVIKERNDDISHLMTETLANLYTEQKLYTKAIKAYGILSEKHPEKKTHFESKINEIKDLRQNK